MVGRGNAGIRELHHDGVNAALVKSRSSSVRERSIRTDHPKRTPTVTSSVPPQPGWKR